MALVKRCLIVPAAYAPLARLLCAGIAGEAGDGMFITPLFSAGNPNATHYISTGVIEDNFAALLPLRGVSTGQPATVVTMSQGLVALAQIQALFAAVDCSDQNPFDAIKRLGLTLAAAAII